MSGNLEYDKEYLDKLDDYGLRACMAGKELRDTCLLPYAKGGIRSMYFTGNLSVANMTLEDRTNHVLNDVGRKFEAMNGVLMQLGGAANKASKAADQLGDEMAVMERESKFKEPDQSNGNCLMSQSKRHSLRAKRRKRKR